MFRIIAALIMLVSSDLYGQALSALDGAWTGTGKLMGRPAEFDICWDSKTLPDLIRLEYRIRHGETTVFRAAGYYRTNNKGATGQWFDSRNVTFDIQIDIDGSESITSRWSGLRESGQTHYKMLGDSALVVSDYVTKDGSPVQFADARYKRVRECPIR